MTNVNPVPAGAGYETAERVSNILNILSYLVVVIGVLQAAAILFAATDVVEPWVLGSAYVVDEDWKTWAFALIGAGGVLIYTAVAWAFIQSARLVVRYVGARPMIAE